jgi:Ser/Thr protein kinase RdoA (MazF antagonist)
MTAVMQHTTPPDAVLEAYGLAGSVATPLGSGLINLTWAVSAGGRDYVLQQVSPIFPPSIHDDIRAVTAHLRRRGLPTPELVATRDGRYWQAVNDRVWRLMTRVPGVSRDSLRSPDEAHAAGALLGRFHGALRDLRHSFSNPRLGVHDTARHLAALRAALRECAQHEQFVAVNRLAQEILALADLLAPLPVTPDRVVHGDPKINNILFAEDRAEAICLVDLDTLGHMPLPLELGDALRSWCNPAGEDSRGGEFSTDLLRHAMAGYAQSARDWILPAEVAAIIPATLTIYVELAARFCADALRESYFGWDPGRFASRSVHNQVRATSQLAAARSLRGQQQVAAGIVAAAFGT